MFNPLQPFEPRFIELFKAKGIKAFAKQVYERGRPDFNENNLQAYVLIHFDSLEAAQNYVDVQGSDPDRELLRLDRAEAVDRIRELIKTANVFTILKIKDAEMKARKVLDKKLRAFIEYKLNWHPSRSDDVIFHLEMQCAEVYAELKFRSQKIKVKLEEIESAKYVL